MLNWTLLLFSLPLRLDLLLKWKDTAVGKLHTFFSSIFYFGTLLQQYISFSHSECIKLIKTWTKHGCLLKIWDEEGVMNVFRSIHLSHHFFFPLFVNKGRVLSLTTCYQFIIQDLYVSKAWHGLWSFHKSLGFTPNEKGNNWLSLQQSHNLLISSTEVWRWHVSNC